jgi:hypothetical protein
MAKVSEKVTEDQANHLVKIWTKKVQTCLSTPVSQQVPYRTGGGGASELRDGVLFVLGSQHAVSVYWANNIDTEIYDVVVSIL